ncbi:hypothetical protein B566_EDAN010120 [Ephemera danica]|nr:hypothetical protein B566_EDAN010120 [Ephemera danica]
MECAIVAEIGAQDETLTETEQRREYIRKCCNIEKNTNPCGILSPNVQIIVVGRITSPAPFIRMLTRPVRTYTHNEATIRKNQHHGTNEHSYYLTNYGTDNQSNHTNQTAFNSDTDSNNNEAPPDSAVVGEATTGPPDTAAGEAATTTLPDSVAGGEATTEPPETAAGGEAATVAPDPATAAGGEVATLAADAATAGDAPVTEDPSAITKAASGDAAAELGFDMT